MLLWGFKAAIVSVVLCVTLLSPQRRKGFCMVAAPE